MPTYTYLCENCENQFDIAQPFSDGPLTICPKCGVEALGRVYRPVGVVFKGSGFYATDNRSPSGVSNNSKSEKSATEGSSDSTDNSSTSPAKEKKVEPKSSEKNSE